MSSTSARDAKQLPTSSNDSDSDSSREQTKSTAGLDKDGSKDSDHFNSNSSTNTHEAKQLPTSSNDSDSDSSREQTKSTAGLDDNSSKDGDPSKSSTDQQVNAREQTRSDGTTYRESDMQPAQRVGARKLSAASTSPSKTSFSKKNKSASSDQTSEGRGSPRFACPNCEKRFWRKTHLTRHSKMHAKEYDFKCPYCDKAFYRKDQYTVHLRSHTNERPYACSVTGCTKRFTQRGALTRHMRTHSNRCRFCQREFETSREVVEHEQGHLASPKRDGGAGRLDPTADLGSIPPSKRSKPSFPGPNAPLCSMPSGGLGAPTDGSLPPSAGWSAEARLRQQENMLVQQQLDLKEQELRYQQLLLQQQQQHLMQQSAMMRGQTHLSYNMGYPAGPMPPMQPGIMSPIGQYPRPGSALPPQPNTMLNPRLPYNRNLPNPYGPGLGFQQGSAQHPMASTTASALQLPAAPTPGQFGSAPASPNKPAGLNVGDGLARAAPMSGMMAGMHPGGAMAGFGGRAPFSTAPNYGAMLSYGSNMGMQMDMGMSINFSPSATTAAAPTPAISVQTPSLAMLTPSQQSRIMAMMKSSMAQPSSTRS
eukprot:TRINITY_DN8744_c0_g2_i1.p1 TRINITY_DN8744_c0_g2~~TRINITY_DN8744_c0_g2_i1.p1  ORF type:complete len:666 (+),score=97.83 TRINITY_DN8744_c0_g2_i1:227-1999(+)